MTEKKILSRQKGGLAIVRQKLEPSKLFKIDIELSKTLAKIILPKKLIMLFEQ